MRISRGELRYQLIQHEAVQGIASIVDVACITADEGWWNEKCFARRHVCLEGRNIPDLDAQLGRCDGAHAFSVAITPVVNPPDTREFPSHIQSSRRTDLQRQPWYRAGTIRRITGERPTGVSPYTLRNRAAFQGGVSAATLDPPGIHRFMRRN